MCGLRQNGIDCNASAELQSWDQQQQQTTWGWFIHLPTPFASQTVQLCVNKCWLRRQTTNNPLPPLLHAHKQAVTHTQLTDGLSSDYKSAPGPKGILGTEGGGLVRVWLWLGEGEVKGLQNRDTKRVPAAAGDEVVKASWAAALRGEGAEWRESRGQRTDWRSSCCFTQRKWPSELDPPLVTLPPIGWTAVNHAATSCRVCLGFFFKPSVASCVTMIYHYTKKKKVKHTYKHALNSQVGGRRCEGGEGTASKHALVTSRCLHQNSRLFITTKWLPYFIDCDLLVHYYVYRAMQCFSKHRTLVCHEKASVLLWNIILFHLN